MPPKIVVESEEKKPTEDDDEILKYNKFGWKNLRWDGFLSRPLTAYTVLCICTFIQNFSVNGANNAVISTLERVFYLDSVQSGLFLALYDLATVFSSPVVGHLGSRYSSPIFFSLNMIIVGFGNMLIASSNFLQVDKNISFNPSMIGNGSIFNTVLFQCNLESSNGRNQTDPFCSKQNRLANGVNNAKFLLYLGNFVNGLGSVALFTIGISYIERIFPRKKAAYCQGIYFAVGTVGGALGIVATGRFLQLYTQFSLKDRLEYWLTPTHPLWIGCWWLPYIIYGGLCLLVGLFVSGLPNFEKPGIRHPNNRVATLPIPDLSPKNPDLKVTNEDTQTTMSNVSSRPPSPIIRRDLPMTNKESIDDPSNNLPVLNPALDQYRLAPNGLRTLRSTASYPKVDMPLETHPSREDYFINHAYSVESITIQYPTSDSSIPSTLTSTESSASIRTTSLNRESPSTTFCQDFRCMCSIIGELVRNPRYLFIIIANLFEGILIKGFVPFITKYFEYQHQLDTSTATLITGAIALLSVIIGCPVGALLINKFNWTAVKCARICTIVLTVSSFLFLFLTLSCPELKFENTYCTKQNSDCCRNKYHPVCQVDQPSLMYLSPCHHGCTRKVNLTNNTNFYSDCRCENDTSKRFSETACQFQRIPCPAIFALTMTGAAFVVFFTALIQVPMLQVLLYSVPLSYQNMALALRQTVVRVLGQTTGPLLFGFVFDQTCSIWLTDCFSRRTCKVYDNRRMGISMALSGFSIRFLSGLACGIVFLHWKFKKVDDEVATPRQTTN